MKLYTLTGNLLAETTAHYPSIAPHRTHRAVSETFQVGGKGINVAKMAQRLGLSSTALCFPGGHTGERCRDWLMAQPFGFKAFALTTETREGWVVRDSEGSETTFLGCDHPVEEKPWRAALKMLGRELKGGDALALCGSVPGWRPALAEPLGELLGPLGEDVFVAVDTYGPPLRDLLQHPIDLVKINREELESILPSGQAGENFFDVLLQIGREHPSVKRWLITAGGGTVFALDENGKIFQMDPPKVEVVSAVGCGDVLLAGILHSLQVDGKSFPDAVAAALPLAAANAASAGIADFEL